MGTYRLFLAFCVLYSHAFGPVFGKNIGVVAVISFFIMSGYVMAILLEKYYPSIADAPAFFVDRAFRIFPHYLFYLLAVLAFAACFGIDDPYVSEFAWWQLVANLVILPLNLYTMFRNALYNPPAWSLGLELTFYLAFPLLWMLGRRWQIVVFCASVAVAMMAFCGALDSNYGGYRLLPGTLIFFIAGASMAAPDKFGSRYAVAVFALALVGLAATLLSDYLYRLPYDFEVSLGAVVGIAAIYGLHRLPLKGFDKLAGDVSYGLFLSHFPMMFVADTLGLARWPFVPAAALVSAWFSYVVVERPILGFRQKLRSRTFVWGKDGLGIATDRRQHG